MLLCGEVLNTLWHCPYVVPKHLSYHLSTKTQCKSEQFSDFERFMRGKKGRFILRDGSHCTVPNPAALDWKTWITLHRLGWRWRWNPYTFNVYILKLMYNHNHWMDEDARRMDEQSLLYVCAFQLETAMQHYIYNRITICVIIGDVRAHVSSWRSSHLSTIFLPLSSY